MLAALITWLGLSIIASLAIGRILRRAYQTQTADPTIPSPVGASGEGPPPSQASPRISSKLAQHGINRLGDRHWFGDQVVFHGRESAG